MIFKLNMIYWNRASLTAPGLSDLLFDLGNLGLIFLYVFLQGPNPSIKWVIHQIEFVVL